MNWFKQAKSPNVQLLSYNSYGELRVLINGKPYTYYNISPFQKDKIERMMNSPRIPGSVILQRLKPFSDPQRHKELNPIPEEEGHLQ